MLLTRRALVCWKSVCLRELLSFVYLRQAAQLRHQTPDRQNVVWKDTFLLSIRNREITGHYSQKLHVKETKNGEWAPNNNIMRWSWIQRTETYEGLIGPFRVRDEPSLTLHVWGRREMHNVPSRKSDIEACLCVPLCKFTKAFTKTTKENPQEKCHCQHLSDLLRINTCI